jgi:hypothetical protein
MIYFTVIAFWIMCAIGYSTARKSRMYRTLLHSGWDADQREVVNYARATEGPTLEWRYRAPDEMRWRPLAEAYERQVKLTEWERLNIPGGGGGDDAS